MCESLILLGLFLKNLRYIEPGIFRRICELTGYEFEDVIEFVSQEDGSCFQVGRRTGHIHIIKDVSNPISPHCYINLKEDLNAVVIESEFRTWIGEEVKKEIRTIQKTEIFNSHGLDELECDIYNTLIDTLRGYTIDGEECEFKLEGLDIAEDTIYEYIREYIYQKIHMNKSERKSITKAYRSAMKVHEQVYNNTYMVSHSKELRCFLDSMSDQTPDEEKERKPYKWNKTASVYIPSSCPTLSTCKEHHYCEHIAINGKCAVNWNGCCRGDNECYSCWDSGYGDKCYGLTCECMKEIFQN